MGFHHYDQTPDTNKFPADAPDAIHVSDKLEIPAFLRRPKNPPTEESTVSHHHQSEHQHAADDKAAEKAENAEKLAEVAATVKGENQEPAKPQLTVEELADMIRQLNAKRDTIKEVAEKELEEKLAPVMTALAAAKKQMKSAINNL